MKSKFILSANMYDYRALIDEFLLTLTPKDIVNISHAVSNGYYSCLIVYKTKQNEPNK